MNNQDSHCRSGTDGEQVKPVEEVGVELGCARGATKWASWLVVFLTALSGSRLAQPANAAGGLEAEAGIWPGGVVVVPPGGEHGAGLGERGEDGLVQALVPEPPDETLGEAF